MVEKVDRKIKMYSLRNEDLVLEPAEVRQIWTSNIYEPSISLLEAYAEDRTKLLRCTKQGILKVAPTGAGFEEYVVKTGTGDDTYISDNSFIFEVQYCRWDILLEDYDAIISFRNKTNTDWGSDIILTTGWHSIDLASYGIRIKNRVSREPTKYQIIAYR